MTIVESNNNETNHVHYLGFDVNPFERNGLVATCVESTLLLLHLRLISSSLFLSVCRLLLVGFFFLLCVVASLRKLRRKIGEIFAKIQNFGNFRDNFANFVEAVMEKIYPRHAMEDEGSD